MKEHFLAVDPDRAPFQQIMDQLRSLIEPGELRPGESLPTVRQLAGDLGVAPNTVARAYAELQEEGWLTCEGRRGTRVATDVPAKNASARKDNLQEAVSRFMASLSQRGYSQLEIASALGRFLKQR